MPDTDDILELGPHSSKKAKVEIEQPQHAPVPVEIMETGASIPRQPLSSRRSVPSLAPSRPPTTTLEEDIRTATQRDLNMTWEKTQAYISLIIVITTCIGVTVSLTLRGIYPERIVAFPSEWWAIVGLVIGFYFGRTNHARTSGAGPTGSSGNQINMNPLDDRG